MRDEHVLGIALLCILLAHALGVLAGCLLAQ